MSTSAFEQIVAALDVPMFIVSAAAHGEVDACLVGFATQCSIEPARFQVCLSTNNETYALARQAESLVVHRIRSDQRELAEHFGGTSAKDHPQKLSEWPWQPGPGGAPVIDDCDWFAGRVLDRFETGDHVAFVLAPSDGECHASEQLGSRAVADIDAGQPAG
jgi:flavin reductase (DIM6/NTAB) family NADH-FMN oxidoreductase RutF